METVSRENYLRVKIVELMVPRLFYDPGTVLYIGAYNRRFSCSLPLYKAGNEITVLEVWEPFLEGLRTSRFKGRVAHFVLGDVTKLEDAPLSRDLYDYSVWLHGPEHVGKGEGIQAVRELEQITKKTVVLAMPWGQNRHGVAYGNPYTQHKSVWYPEDFPGYQISATGPKDRLGGNLLLWKDMDNRGKG